MAIQPMYTSIHHKTGYTYLVIHIFTERYPLLSPFPMVLSLPYDSSLFPLPYPLLTPRKNYSNRKAVQNEMRNRTHKNRRNKHCGKHRCYLTREDACHNMLLLANSENCHPYEQMFNVYRCKTCQEFHVGHMPFAVRERYNLNNLTASTNS